MIPANLIINADDFGLDARVSLAIARCLDEGLINSFSVFPFADAFHDRLLRDIIARHPQAKVGVHLSLIGPSAAAPVDLDHGGFREHENHFQDFLSLYFTGRYPVARVHAEWKAQIEFAGGYVGGPHKLAHLDSHQHLHVLPGLWGAACSLRREFSIPRLRVPYESLLRGVTYRFPFGLGMQVLARLRAGFSSAAFLGFFTSTAFTLEGNRSGLKRVLSRPKQEFELMVHPALPKAEVTSELPMGAGCVAASQEREIEELRKLRDFFGKGAGG